MAGSMDVNGRGNRQWWASLFVAASLSSGVTMCNPAAVAQDEFDAPPGSALEILESPFSFPDDNPLVLEDPPSPPLPEGNDNGTGNQGDLSAPSGEVPDNATNESGQNGDRTGAEKESIEASDDLSTPGRSPARTRVSGRNGVADFTKKSSANEIVRRELTREEQRIVTDTLRRSERLRTVSEGAFREGQTSLSQYAQYLDVAVKMAAVTSEILDRPELQRAAIESQGALIREASQQLTRLNQPNGGRWNSELMLSDVLLADTMVQLAALQKDQNKEQYESSVSQRMQAAQRLFEQRLRDYQIGWADLSEITHAARYLIPPSTTDMNPEQKAAITEAIAEYQQVLVQADSRVELWNRSKANMGTEQLMPIVRNDGYLTPLSPLGADGTGLGADDDFAALHVYDELLARSATRPSPLAHDEIFPSQFDQTGVDAGAGRIDHVQQTQSELLVVTAQIAEMNGDKSLAQSAYTRSFEVAQDAFKTELELYQNGTASLGDVTHAWMAGQVARQGWEQSGYGDAKNWTDLQRSELNQLQDLTEGRQDRRGAGMSDLELIGSLQSFEAIRDLKVNLDREMAAQQTAQDATSAVSGGQFERVQTFVPETSNPAAESLKSEGVRSDKSTSPAPRSQSFVPE